MVKVGVLCVLPYQHGLRMIDSLLHTINYLEASRNPHMQAPWEGAAVRTRDQSVKRTAHCPWKRLMISWEFFIARFMVRSVVSATCVECGLHSH